MNRTKNDLSLKVREAVIPILNENLATCVDLQTQLKQAHWNVKGPHFIGLHELFDTIAGEVYGYADQLAERAVELGGTVHGTARVAAKVSKLKEYPLDIKAGADHVDAVSTALAGFGASVREAIDKTDELGDADTADLFTEISRGIDKSLWFVEAHLEPDPPCSK